MYETRMPFSVSSGSMFFLHCSFLFSRIWLEFHNYSQLGWPWRRKFIFRLVCADSICGGLVLTQWLWTIFSFSQSLSLSLSHLFLSICLCLCVRDFSSGRSMHLFFFSFSFYTTLRNVQRYSQYDSHFYICQEYWRAWLYQWKMTMKNCRWFATNWCIFVKSKDLVLKCKKPLLWQSRGGAFRSDFTLRRERTRFSRES